MTYAPHIESDLSTDVAPSYEDSPEHAAAVLSAFAANVAAEARFKAMLADAIQEVTSIIQPDTQAVGGRQ